MTKLTKKFRADDDFGRSYIIDEWTNCRQHQTFEGTATSEGMKKLVTTCGQNVNRLKKGEYQIRLTGIVLRSSDPYAS